MYFIFFALLKKKKKLDERFLALKGFFLLFFLVRGIFSFLLFLKILWLKKPLLKKHIKLSEKQGKKIILSKILLSSFFFYLFLL